MQAVDNLAEPTDHHGVRQLVGMASFYRRWISDFACMVAPLTDMSQLVDDPRGTIDPKTGRVRKDRMLSIHCGGRTAAMADFDVSKKTEWLKQSIASLCCD